MLPDRRRDQGMVHLFPKNFSAVSVLEDSFVLRASRDLVGQKQFKEDIRNDKSARGGFSISLDGFGAGPEQSLENPLGKRGRELHPWFFHTRSFKAMIGQDGGSEGLDERYAHRAMDGFGAFILGRNMFGPAGNDWAGPTGRAGGGQSALSRADLHPDPSRPGADRDGRRHHFHLRHRRNRGRARSGQARRRRTRRQDRRRRCDVRQYLRAGLIDELHFAVSPVVLGQGEAMFAGIDLPSLGYRVTEHQASEQATHFVLGR